MYRSAPLLILLAFVLGLWIGFNTEAHARAEAAWQQADEAAVDLGARLTAGLDKLFDRVSEESPPPANPPLESKPSNFLGQVEAALAQLWEALVRLWESLVNRAASTT